MVVLGCVNAPRLTLVCIIISESLSCQERNYELWIHDKLGCVRKESTDASALLTREAMKCV